MKMQLEVPFCAAFFFGFQCYGNLAAESRGARKSVKFVLRQFGSNRQPKPLNRLRKKAANYLLAMP